MGDWSHDLDPGRRTVVIDRHVAHRSTVPIAMPMTYTWKAREVARTEVVDAPVERVYEALVDPQQQLQWNSLYLEAAITPPRPIATGTVMTGRFKGSGRAVVVFDAVVPGRTFTHVSDMRAGPVAVGKFRHTYRIRQVGEGTEVFQHVAFAPSGVAYPFAPLIMRAFRSRLPASFDELRHYLARSG